MTSRRLPFLAVAVVALLALVVALPAFAADPSPSAGPGTQSAPGQQKDRKAKAPEKTVTVTGTVTKTTDDKGRPAFTLTAGGTTYQLSAGPAWYWGVKSPLATYAGTSVEIKGTQREGSTEIDVESVDGKALRESGKPPWAGGPWRVGPSHPGWKDWMVDGKPGLGRAHAPGQLKDRTPDSDEESGGS